MAFKIKDGVMIGSTSIYNSSGQIIPTSAGSTALFTGLNADLLDGKHADEFALESSIGNGVLTIVGGTGMTLSSSVAGMTFSANQSSNKSITINHYIPPTVPSNSSTAINQFISYLGFDSFGHASGMSTSLVDFSVSDNWAFRNVGISTDTGYSWGAVNTNITQAAESSSDTLTLVSGFGVNLYASNVGGTDAIKIEHGDTSPLNGVYGTNGIASFSVDDAGHVMSVTTENYLTAESDTLSTVTARGATTASAITINNSTASTSTSTGALIVAGGLGITGQITNGGGILITNTTASTTTSTGALRVAGGVGITGNLNVGGNSTIGGTLLINNTTNSTSTTTGALRVSGGIGATGNIYTGGYISSSGGILSNGPVIIYNATDSTSSTNGSITTAGGVGIEKNLFVGGSVNIAGNLFVGGTSSIINSGQVTIKDTILWLGGTSGSTAGDMFDKGVIYSYWDNAGATSKLGFFGWDESEDKFTYLNNVTETNGIVSGTPGTIKAGLFEGGTFNGYLNGNALTSTTATVALGVTGDLTFHSDYFNVTSTNVLYGYDGSENVQVTLLATSTNTANRLVYRDSSGGFAAGNVSFTGLTASGISIFTNNTASTSTSTGAVIVTGGVGIGGSANIGGNLNVTGPVIFSNSTGSTTTSTGALLIAGGLGITGQITNGGGILITNATTSTSTSSGALRVNGGVGITGNLNVGGNSTINGTLSIGQTATVGNLNTSGKITTTNNTPSVSTSTGAVIVTGGVGIGGSVNIGGNLDVIGEIINSAYSGYAITRSAVNKVTIASTVNTVIDTFSAGLNRSAKYIIQITQGTSYQVSEVMVIHNNTTTMMTEYAVLETNGSLATLTSGINGSNIELKVSMLSAISADILIYRTGMLNTNP